MNRHLIEILDADGIDFEPLAKSDKIRLLKRWSAAFPSLLLRARKGIQSAGVLVDPKADAFVASRAGGAIYLLPDDASAMPSLRCRVTSMPDLNELLSDTYTTCDEIVVVDEEFTWSCVLVNHGAAGVGRYAAAAGCGDME